MTDLPNPSSPFRIGTRGSPLALAQAHETRARLSVAFDLVEEAFEIEVPDDAVEEMRTIGDIQRFVESHAS